MNPSRDKPNAETGVTDEIIAEEVQAHGLARRIGPVRRLYQWVLFWAETRHAAKAMALLAYTEAIFFPVPADLLLGALCLGKPRRSFHWALIATVFSVLGGTTAVLLGGWLRHYFTLEDLGTVLGYIGLNVQRLREADAAMKGEWGFLAIGTSALTPVPYMAFSWVAGYSEMPLWKFVLASAIFRPLRFYGVAGLMYLFGARAKAFIDRYFNLATVLFMVVVIAVVVAVKYLRP
ncbi:MAG: DedA family protein [Phycisphaerae bacterium]|nr:DedA family protein [Phycisphaerae bacterium]